MNKFIIDLTGPSGNAYALLGYASKFSEPFDINFEEVREKMMSGDYENLVTVFEEYFGEYVEIIR